MAFENWFFSGNRSGDFGPVGDPNHLEYTVIVDVVNLSAKREKKNKVAGVASLTAADAYREARAQIYLPLCKRCELGETNVAGVEQAIGLIVTGK